jgi:hypothetical protein
VIASAREPVRAALAALLLAAASCRGPAGLPPGSPLEPLAGRGAYVPDEVDRAAHDLATAALAPVSDAHAAQARLEALDAERRDAGAPPTGLVPVARHVVDASLGDPLAYRRATDQLLDRDDLDPALRRELELERDDDPLRVAGKRMGEARRIRIARAVNALSEALGTSALTVALAPFRVAQAVLGVAVAEHMDDPIRLQERQALVQWKRYVEEHPDTAEARRLIARIDDLQERWFETKRRRSAKAAREALDAGQPTVALVLADRALHYAPEDRESTALRDEARSQVARARTSVARSEEAPAELPELARPEARVLAVALFARDADLAGAADALLGADPKGPLAGEAHFARAIALGERGQEDAMWEELGELAGRDEAQEGMARHARVLLASPAQNPYAAFRAARASGRKEMAGFVLLGPLAHGPRDRDLPKALEWMLEGPALMGTLGGIPTRLVKTALARPVSPAPAVHARHYLDLHPDGEHAKDVRSWLVGYLKKRGNWMAAHRVAASAPDPDPDVLAHLAEKAADQAVELAKHQKRRDMRFAMLREAASRYRDTPGGRRAGELARSELRDATPQRIRISRGFLLENPEVAGPAGLGLRPELLDGDSRNGELHADGVTLLGGRVVEFALLAASGKHSDPPERVRQAVSDERLARLVALLDETAERNALLDPLADHAPDADRDLFFERARLGVADVPDSRPTAESTYSFVGVREKYGLVRPRESILPVDLVIQGSFPDLGLGAFPRMRMPKETPDAVLYR